MWPWTKIAQLEKDRDEHARASAEWRGIAENARAEVQDLRVGINKKSGECVTKDSRIRELEREIRQKDAMLKHAMFRDPKTGRLGKKGQIPKGLK